MTKREIVWLGVAAVALYVLTRPKGNSVVGPAGGSGPAIIIGPPDLTQHAIDPNNPLVLY